MVETKFESAVYYSQSLAETTDRLDHATDCSPDFFSQRLAKNCL